MIGRGSRSGRASRIGRGIGLALTVLLAAGCASAAKSALKRVSAESSRSFAAGDYGRALELYQKLYEKDRTDGRIVSGYAATIESVKSAADEARDKGRCEAARKAYRSLAEGWDGFSALAPRLSFKRADLENGVRDCLLAAAERQFRQETGAGSWSRAIASFQAVLKEFQTDPKVRAQYVRALGQLREIGAGALAGKEFALAGRVHGSLLRNVETFAGLDGTAVGSGLSREELEDVIRQSTAAMTLDGLTEYRKGNLEGAVATWEELLAFDPANPEVRKAVETAKAQLGKLKSSGRGGGKNGKGGKAGRSAR